VGGPLIFIFMELYNVMNAINKYVEKIIMRKFPEISAFDVGLSSSRRIPDHIRNNHPEGTKFYLIDVKFYFDEIEDERRDDLYESIKNMKRVLSLSERFDVRHYLEYK
jgi:hypothetical protein